jgi:hypothetical protein
MYNSLVSNFKPWCRYVAMTRAKLTLTLPENWWRLQILMFAILNNQDVSENIPDILMGYSGCSNYMKLKCLFLNMHNENPEIPLHIGFPLVEESS